MKKSVVFILLFSSVLLSFINTEKPKKERHFGMVSSFLGEYEGYISVNLNDENSIKLITQTLHHAYVFLLSVRGWEMTQPPLIESFIKDQQTQIANETITFNLITKRQAGVILEICLTRKTNALPNLTLS